MMKRKVLAASLVLGLVGMSVLVQGANQTEPTQKSSKRAKDGKAIKLDKPITHDAVEIVKGGTTSEIVVAPDGTVVEPAGLDAPK